jgi:ADP-ribose pyrophosphatase YjhB (NUDIX family)
MKVPLMKVRNEVQGIIFDKSNGGHVLLVRKQDRKVRHFHWRLLKGGINEGETKVEALCREILEETGLKNIKILDQVHNYEFVFKGLCHRVSSFLVSADSSEPVKLQESELSDYVWAESENARELLYWYNEREALRKLGQLSESS